MVSYLTDKAHAALHSATMPKDTLLETPPVGQHFALSLLTAVVFSCCPVLIAVVFTYTSILMLFVSSALCF